MKEKPLGPSPNLDIVKPAIAAIRKASRITTYLQPTSTTQGDNVSGITKSDTSPVTIGDFAAQAIVLNLLETQSKNDVFIAEESSKNLSDDLSEEIMNVPLNQIGRKTYSTFSTGSQGLFL